MQVDPVRARKQQAARAALEELHEGMSLGVGTGSTVNELIAMLGAWRGKLGAVVSSSEASTRLLADQGITTADLNEVESLSLYIDGADEATAARCLIKGGGAALTREKIVAAAARRFLCIIDPSKLVPVLGRFPLPVEVIPMARNQVARRLEALGARPVWRAGVVTDNGNHLLDLHGLQITDPLGLESAINQITGVVCVGLFAARPADLLVIGHEDGVERI
ncbi:MAG TPA: ribose-5-phosphate isomerase RpiA [Steroidobacteraceae bacterium]|nr:ribose-5-phosphate isomerase RpiA [Steroidobacteraceae bacterium]